MITRKIDRIFHSKPTIEGAGVHLKRAFSHGETEYFDPFLMLDDFHSSNPADYTPGFPWHPHRGIETITYIIQGLVEHGDSMGNKGEIRDGEVQWMTAGSGIIHQEMPQITPAGVMQGFQLWANLPAAQKMMHPRYRDIKAADIPKVTLDGGAAVKIISGTVQGVQGPVRDIVIDPEVLDVSLPAGSSFTHPVKAGYTIFAYVIAGNANFGAFSLFYAEHVAQGPTTVILYQREGDQVVIQAGDKPVRFLLMSGRPLNEPIAWGGPIVMNTEEELRTAFEELKNNSFIKHK